MNWLFAFLLGWHPPLEVPPVPPLDWRRKSFGDIFLKDRGFDISLAPTHEVLRVKTTSISIPYGCTIVVLLNEEQMSILEAAYPTAQVHCGIDVTFYAPGK